MLFVQFQNSVNFKTPQLFHSESQNFLHLDFAYEQGETPDPEYYLKHADPALEEEINGIEVEDRKFMDPENE